MTIILTASSDPAYVIYVLSFYSSASSVGIFLWITLFVNYLPIVKSQIVWRGDVRLLPYHQ